MSGWLQLFYQGSDNGLWTRSRDPGGNWSGEGGMGGYLTSDPAAAAIPGKNTLQLFYRGGDNGLWTRWTDPGRYWLTCARSKARSRCASRVLDMRGAAPMNVIERVRPEVDVSDDQRGPAFGQDLGSFGDRAVLGVSACHVA